MREMKDSVIPFLDKIPSDWQEKPIRYLFREITDKNKFGAEKTALKFTYGTIIPKTDFDADTDDYVANTILNYTLVTKGVIMINCLNLNFDFVSQRIGLVKDKGAITSAYLAIKPNEQVLPEFANYELKYFDAIKAFHNMGTGVRKTLDFTELGKKYFAFPSILEQERIVSFLDTKCTEIDALSADIQSEIDALEAYKRSVITEAVTKGLDKNVPMKDSGIAEIGNIPTSWEISKTKYIAEISIGLVTTMTSNYVDNLNDGVHLIRNGDIRLNKIEPNGMVYISKKFVDRNANRKLKLNDIVTVHTGYIGTSALINKEYEGSVGFATIQSRPKKDIVNERFLCWFYNSSAFIEQCMAHNTGDGRQNLNLYDFVDFWVALPSVTEQNRIADYIDAKVDEIDAIISMKKEQLEIFADYKKSVIYEYVTGKKEVCS